MCGIAGIIGEIHTDRKEMVSAMLSSIKHRGPDASAVQLISNNVALGHNRLSIIDLSVAANQPFASGDGRYTIVFNGEIYNYLELRKILISEFHFRTHSDTEVLLAAYSKWGASCLDQLIGMFSFAIWDDQEKIFFAARDRFGVKPFYYSDNSNNVFLFASEIKALWSAGVPRIRNEKVWSSFFVHASYGMPEETFWSGINQLPGGHYLLWRDGKKIIKKWYSFTDRIEEILPQWREASENEISERYFELLRESIHLRFRSDVPVGFNVSGGLDSSLLLSLIKESFPNNKFIEAFTFYTGNAAYDELPWVKDLMNTTTYPLHAVPLKSEEIPWLAQEMAILQDEPFGGFPTLAYSQLFKEARSMGTIVLLDGQGMDEAWAGYDYYQTGSVSVIQGVKGSAVRPDVLDLDFRNLAEEIVYPEPFQDRLLNLQYRDLFYTKLPRALRFNDRASMKYSTELREPFLDHRLVEMAFALPIKWKIKSDTGTGKYMLRKMASQLMPDTIRLAPKRPLQTPQREWLAHELRDWATEKIRIFSNSDGVDKTALLMEWDSYLNYGSDNSFYIWQWINSSYLI